MRVVIIGLGGIGGVLAARLHQASHQVVGIARGSQLSAIREQGLRLESPAESVTVHIGVRSHPAEVAFDQDDVVVLAVKSQDTAATVHALAETAPAGIPVLCAQNGVFNEPHALRYFSGSTAWW